MGAYEQGRNAALEKFGWFGKYYHGTSASNEPAILREGLKGSMGGAESGASGALRRFGDLPGMPAPIAASMGVSADAFQDQSKGLVHISPSKSVARMYAMLHDAPNVIRRVGGQAYGQGAIAGFRQLGSEFLDRQPLQIDGKGLPLKRDSQQPLGKTYQGDIPANKITKATPSNAGNIIRRWL